MNLNASWVAPTCLEVSLPCGVSLSICWLCTLYRQLGEESIWNAIQETVIGKMAQILVIPSFLVIRPKGLSFSMCAYCGRNRKLAISVEALRHLSASVLGMSTSSHIYTLYVACRQHWVQGRIVESPEVNHDYFSSSNATSTLPGMYLHIL